MRCPGIHTAIDTRFDPIHSMLAEDAIKAAVKDLETKRVQGQAVGNGSSQEAKAAVA